MVVVRRQRNNYSTDAASFAVSLLVDIGRPSGTPAPHALQHSRLRRKLTSQHTIQEETIKHQTPNRKYKIFHTDLDVDEPKCLFSFDEKGTERCVTHADVQMKRRTWKLN